MFLLEKVELHEWQTISFIGDGTQSNMLQNHNTSRPVDTSTMLVPLYSILWHLLFLIGKHTLRARLLLNPYPAKGYKRLHGVKKMHLVRLCHRRRPDMGPKSLPEQRHPSGVLKADSACGARSPRFESWGNPLCWSLPLQGDSLDTRKRGVG